VIVDAMPEDAKLSRAFADEAARLGREVARLKPADLAKPLRGTIVWFSPRSGGLESADGDRFHYKASVRAVAIDGATHALVFAKTIEKEGSRERVSDVLGLLDEFQETH